MSMPCPIKKARAFASAWRKATTQEHEVEDALDGFFRSLDHQVEDVHETELFSLNLLRDFPVSGMFAAVSRGISHFPARTHGGECVRREICLSLRDLINPGALTSLFSHVCERIVQQVDEHALRTPCVYDFTAFGPKARRLGSYAVLRNVWLSPRDCQVSAAQRIRLDEVVPITASEAWHDNQGRYRFIKNVATGRIDLLDLGRT